MRQLKEIVGDRKKGAGELLEEALRWLEHQAAGTAGVDWNQVVDTLRAGRPIMAAFSVLADCLEAARRQGEDLSQALLRLKQEWAESEQRVAAAFAAVADKWRLGTVTTISWSSAVRMSLMAAQQTVRKVYVLRSEPGGEGARTATWLRQHGRFFVELIADEQMGNAVDSSDAVVFGADAVIPGAGVINKVKSKALAQCACERGRPVIVVSSRWKFSRRRPEELLESEPSGVFELVPQQYISLVVTEATEPAV